MTQWNRSRPSPGVPAAPGCPGPPWPPPGGVPPRPSSGAPRDIREYLSSLDITLSNALFALDVAVVSFIVIHGALALFRRQLSRLTHERVHRPVAEVLQWTLGRTSNLAIAATSILIGLSVLDLPLLWHERVNHLWFITLGLQLAMYLHNAVAVSARRYFRAHSHGRADDQVTVAHTLVIWVLQTSVWTIFALALLSNLGINVTTFVASLGIGGVAIALAVQNILGDKASFDRAHVKALDQQYVEFEIVYIMQTADYNLFMDTQQNIILAAMRMFIDLGISTLTAPQPMLVEEMPGSGPQRAQGSVRSLH